MVTALVLSGGSGARMGMAIPKQYIEINGRAVISYCLERFFMHEMVNAVQIVAAEEWRETILQSINSLCEQGVDGNHMQGQNVDVENNASYVEKGKFCGFSEPGKTRQLSILNGLNDIRKYAGDSDYVLIHDAARPLLSGQMITDCIKAVRGRDGVLPVLPMKDTVYFSKDGMRISSLLERSRIFAGQAPELFVLGKYYEANRALLPDKILEINGSMEPAVMAGMDIVMIPGDEGNFKITTAADLEHFREIVQKKRG